MRKHSELLGQAYEPYAQRGPSRRKEEELICGFLFTFHLTLVKVDPQWR